MNILKFLGIGVASTSYVAARYGTFGSNIVHLNDTEDAGCDSKTGEENGVFYKNIENKKWGFANRTSYWVVGWGPSCKINKWYVRPIDIIHTDLQGQSRRY